MKVKSAKGGYNKWQMTQEHIESIKINKPTKITKTKRVLAELYLNCSK